MPSTRSADALLRWGLAGGLVLLAGVGLVCAWLGVDGLAQLDFLPPCPFHAVTGVPCPGCGMTRAFLLLAQLRVGEALAAHPLAPALLLAMAWTALGRPGAARIAGAAAAGCALALVLGVWVARSV